MATGKALPVTFELITPAYAGAADRTKTDGLRPPTLKALLRFWWRAMHPGDRPGQLFQRESEIFGSTGRGQGLRLVPVGDWPAWRSDGVGTEETKPIFQYLAYGPITRSGGRFRLNVERLTVDPVCQKLVVKIVGPGRFQSAEWDEVRGALWLLSAFGGIGSRSRRGWGSLRIHTQFSEFTDPHSGTDEDQTLCILRKGLKSLVPNSAPVGDPQHTSLSAGMRVALGSKVESWKEALKNAGKAYYDYRRALGAEFGHRPGQGGPDWRLRSQWLANGVTSGSPAPQATSFGLPLNAYFSRSRRKADVGVGTRLDGRRASPVFIKILRVGNGFAPVIAWLPSLLLPSNMWLHAKVDRGGSVQVTYPGAQAIAEFYDGNPSLCCYSSGGAWRGLLPMGWTRVW